MPVGQHLANTPGILNAHRVLNADGRVAEAFRWLNPEDDRDVRVVLAQEGIRFGDDGRAAADQRLDSEELAGLIDVEIEPAPVDEDRRYGWRTQRMVRYLRHFYETEGGRLHADDARRLAVVEGYDPRGTAGFYQGTASLRRDGRYRVLTDAGGRFYEENRYRLE